jgi:hypothetical protein
MPTTISVTQAFHDVGIVAPAEIRDMRYEADPQAYAPFPNPLEAVFWFPCGQTAGFAKGSNLQ